MSTVIFYFEAWFASTWLIFVAMVIYRLLNGDHRRGFGFPVVLLACGGGTAFTVGVFVVDLISGYHAVGR